MKGWMDTMEKTHNPDLDKQVKDGQIDNRKEEKRINCPLGHLGDGLWNE